MCIRDIYIIYIYTYIIIQMGRIRDEKRRRKKIKIRESLRRKKMQVREKIEKSRFTVFFQ